jgi:phosphoribosyl-ATP pyrophosphohydrolase
MTANAHVLDRLAATIRDRRTADPASSYTARLLAGGPGPAARKLGEEALETVIAAIAEPPEKLIAESADLLYHLLVLWEAAGVNPDRVWQALAAREGQSGLAEKAARPRS